MKLIFDCRFIRVEHHDGISRFSSELFTAVSGKHPVVALISDLRQLEKLPDGTEYILENDPTNGFQEMLIARRLNAHNPTHVFSPMQTMGSWGRKYKLILTLHDLIYYAHPKAPPFLPWHVKVAWRLYHLNFLGARVLLNRADAVATVSKTSKQLIEKFNLTRKEVLVLYNAPESRGVHANASGKPNASSRKLVYMGSFMEYKNVECLIAGMKFLPEFTLVLLSPISQSRQEELKLVADRHGSQIEFRNGVSEQEYAKELTEAFALVSASKDEGFGIPLVEAMQHGLPIVVSDIPIFREVAGQSALYFDPENPEAFSDCINLLKDSESWKKLGAESEARANRFSWDETADSLLEALERL